jgi:Ca2+-binding RTX toxin-like protein
MATHTIDHDRTAQWKINQDNDTWTLDANAQLYVTGQPAIVVGAGFDGNTLNINGDILNTGTSSWGTFVMADKTTINVGAKSEIKAAAGVWGVGANTTIVNKGDIEANYNGVVLAQTGHVTNSGEISGSVAIVLGSEGTNPNATFENLVVNHKGGEILGFQAGIQLTGNAHQTVINDGLISAFGSAVLSTTGDLHLVNRGRIDGNIQLGDGGDVIDTRKGVVHGEIRGGDNDDVYLIGKGPANIVEHAVEGYDVVKSVANATLTDNVETLVLLGKANLTGHGNAMLNTLQGNSGDNKLFGEAGIDFLSGGKGNDLLTGGADADTFIFHKGDGVDTVTDFENVFDHITLVDFNITTFSQLQSHISAHGDDVWIAFGSDKLVLQDTKLSDMDTNDFHF